MQICGAVLESAEISGPGWRTSCLMAPFVTKKTPDGTIRDEENDDPRAGCKLGRGDAVQIYVRLSHGLCGIKLICVAVGCAGFSTKFCTIRISLSFCFF